MSKFVITLVSMWKIVIDSNYVVNTALHKTGNWKGDSWLGIVLELQNGSKAFHLSCYVILQIIKSVLKIVLWAGAQVFLFLSHFQAVSLRSYWYRGEGGQISLLKY